VTEFIDDARPASVWDLGANTGLFSRIASGRGIHTVAFDMDPLAVEKNYLTCRERGDENLLPLINDLRNPSPAIGWEGQERMSILERGPADVALALALVHHLAIGNNVPLDRISRLFHRLSRRLIIEFIPKSDTQVQRLLATRKDIFPDYQQRAFELAFEAHFRLAKRRPIEGSERTLYLFERC
jgi:ribosomal protein L11 methylase PrmA